MPSRRERVRIETARHEIEGTLQLPHEGFRSRLTDFLNTHTDDFLALTDARVAYLDGSREPEEHEYLALATRHVVLVAELGQVGTVDEPAPIAFTASAPPPSA
jgi:hypothetical protein